MSLDPFFSLSPLSPSMYTYDAANPSDPYAYACMGTYGGRTYDWGDRTLERQHADNQLLLARDPVAESEQTIADYASDVARRCAVRLSFKGTNVTTTNQYLLIFRLARKFGSPIAQFFIGTDLVRAEPLTTSPHDDIAILLDVPGDKVYVKATVRLAAAGSSCYHGFFYKGVDGYLL